jgi:hypothetical protein
LDFRGKLVAQTGALIIVIIYGFSEFILRAGQDQKIHRRLILAITSSAGEALISPFLYASILDSTSAAQAESVRRSPDKSKL